MAQKVQFAAAKVGMIAYTGRFDLRRGKDVIRLLEAFEEKLERAGHHDPELKEKIREAKELKKEWDEVVAPRRKTVTCKVYINNGFYEQVKKYAAAKRYAEAVDDGRLGNMVDNLDARMEMLRQKICELEEDLEILKDLMDGDT